MRSRWGFPGGHGGCRRKSRELRVEGCRPGASTGERLLSLGRWGSTGHGVAQGVREAVRALRRSEAACLLIQVLGRYPSVTHEWKSPAAFLEETQVAARSSSPPAAQGPRQGACNCPSVTDALPRIRHSLGLLGNK